LNALLGNEHLYVVRTAGGKVLLTNQMSLSGALTR
jgi:hypothetical protein